MIYTNKFKEIPVLSIKDKTRFLNFIEINERFSGCWKWLGPKNKGGYGFFKLIGKNYSAHRISYFFNYKLDPGPFLVCHSCDNRSCVNPTHFFLGTHKDNAIDKTNKGRGVGGKALGPKGERQGRSKLKNKDIIKIRQLWAKGTFRQSQLAERFGVGQQMISLIVNGKNWKHI